MSDFAEPHPPPSQQQSAHPESAHTAGLATPPPSFGDDLCIPLDGGSSATTLPRNPSAISLGPEACHIEDIDAGCGHEHQKHSILHSATHTPAISRNPSRVDVTHGSAMSWGLHEGNFPEQEEQEGGADDDGGGEKEEEYDDGVLEMKPPSISGDSENVHINPPTDSSPTPPPETTEVEEGQLPKEAQYIPSVPETLPEEVQHIFVPEIPLEDTQHIPSVPEASPDEVQDTSTPETLLEEVQCVPFVAETLPEEAPHVPSPLGISLEETEHLPPAQETSPEEAPHVPSLLGISLEETEHLPPAQETSLEEAPHVPSTLEISLEETEHLPPAQETSPEEAQHVSSVPEVLLEEVRDISAPETLLEEFQPPETSLVQDISAPETPLEGVQTLETSLEEVEDHHVAETSPEEAQHVSSAPENAQYITDPEASLVEAAIIASSPALSDTVDEQPAVEFDPAPVSECATAESDPAPPASEHATIESDPSTAPPASEYQTVAGDIDWQFDDMAALRDHITGPTLFEEPERETPARSSTFPPVPPHDENSTTAHYDNEKALFNMMASEAVNGDGIFSSPNAEQGGFPGASDNTADDNLFDNVFPSEKIDHNVTAMMAQVLDAAGIGRPALGAGENTQNDAARLAEEAPSVDHSRDPETTKVSDLFGDTETEAGGDFFASLGGNSEEFLPELKMMAGQGVENETHPSHSAISVATGLGIADGQVLSSHNPATEGKDSLFDLLPSADGDDFFSQIGQQPQVQEPENTQEDDLAARWKAALAGDVLDDEDGFLPSDDEGFLPDSDDESSPPEARTTIHGTDGQLQGFPTAGPGAPPQQPTGRYTPQQAQPPYGGTPWQQPPLQKIPLNPYAPHQPTSFSPSATQPYFNQPPAPSPYAAFTAQTPELPGKKAESFVDKKAGYQSPYDLPMDVIPSAIRKRHSNLGPQGTVISGFTGMAGPLPPIRSSSMGSTFSSTTSTPGAQRPGPQPQKFFEELPIAPPKPRTVSAMGIGSRYSPNPAGQLPPRSAGGYAPQLTGSSRVGGLQEFYPQSPQKSFSQPVVGSTQQPVLQQQSGNRYSSPAPRYGSGAYAPPPPAPTSAPAVPGYQSSPPGSIPTANSPYAPTAGTIPATPPKYAPRPAGPPQMGTRPMGTPPRVVGNQLSPQGIASPTQHFAQLHGFPIPGASGQSQEDAYPIAQRRFSGDHYSMHSSRPGTARSISISAAMDVPREEEELAVEDSPVNQSNGYSASAPAPPQNRYAPSRGSGTPAPGQISRANTFTPPPGVLQPSVFTNSPEATFQPPQRAQTQSPGMVFGRNNKIGQKQRDPYERPSSAFAHTGSYSHPPLGLHQRSHSLQLNFMTPTDETGRDVLKRWQGAPLFSWGFGGNIAVMFPRRAQRYTSDMQQPMIKCSPGEIKIRNIKEILPLEEIEDKFPGPVWSGGRNKGKKKDVLAWMGTKIEVLEKESEGQGKRAAEKVLLWKVVRVLLENDGVLEGNPEVDKAVRGVLTPEVVAGPDGDLGGDHGGSFTMVGDISANMQGPSADRVDPEAVRMIKTNLLKGDRTAAVWHAADKRLWSHALLIASTVGKDLWKQVVQEFVKHEVKTLGEGVESLAVLYEILAGNWAESVDELVSASTRVGVPMLGGAPNGNGNVEEKLDRWRETLGLVLNNRSPGDAEAILALGKLLVGYGRVEAGHICFVFARQGSMGGIGAVLGGHEDPAAHFSLLGVEGGANFTPKDTDAVMLSEIYELALSLTPTAHPAFPHLLSFKLHRAMVRAENGHKAEAQKYVDAIISAIKGSNKPSAHINSTLMAAVEELNTRLSFAPKDAASGAPATGAGKWIPKLNSETVTSSIWETFNTFVSGEKDEASAAAEQAGMDSSVMGPFARMSSESPTMSRVQSGVDLHSANMYSAYNTTPNYGGGPQNNMNPRQYQPPVAAGKYSLQTRNSFESQQSQYSPTANHQRKSSADSYRPGYTGGGYESGGPYEPSGNPYEPKPQQQTNQYDSPQPSANSTTGFGGNANMYDSFDEPQSSAPTTGYKTPADSPSFGGYDPPNSGGGYEPPSDEFTPYEPKEDNDDDETDDKAKPKQKPKKKGFMDDDDDDDEFLKKVEKSKQEEEKKKAAAAVEVDSNGKKGWFGWFKKDTTPATPVAKLGEESSFVYDPDLKRWINKKGGESSPVTAKPPPPPMGRASTPTTSNGMPSRPPSVAPLSPVKRDPAPTGTSTGVPSRPSSTAPPPPPPPPSVKRSSTPSGISTGVPSRPSSVAPSHSELPRASTPFMTPMTPTTPVTPGTPGMLSAPPPPMGRSPSPMASQKGGSPPPSTTGPPPPSPLASKPLGGGPPSRPPTAMGKSGDPMDDLLGPPGANVSRKSTPGVGRKARGKSRYVEVIPGQQ